jgi:hypothetical protein
MLLLCILFSLFSSIYCCNQCLTFSRTNLPISTRIGANCKCVNIYPPSNYDYVDVSYNYGQKITQLFYQNNQLIGECELSKNCNKRFILNPFYGLTIITIRETLTNTYGTISQNGHYINFGKQNNILTEYLCNYPPEINVDSDEQTGFIFAGCIYNYTQTFANNFIIDMDFNNTITIQISTLNQTILYYETSNTFFNQFNSNFDTFIIIIMSNYNVKVNWMNMYENYFNDDTIQNNSSSSVYIKEMAISGLVIAIIGIIFIILFGIYFEIKSKNKNKINKINKKYNLDYDEL